MTLTNEDLLAMSQLLDVKLQPIEKRTKNIELLLENDVLPRLQNIENCYTTTYRRQVTFGTREGTDNGSLPYFSYCIKTNW